MDSTILRRGAGLVGAAVLGGALALGGAVLLGVGGETTTVRELVRAPSLGTAPTAFRQGRPLSINEIYRRSAPGVVQVTSTSVVKAQADPFFGNPFGAPESETQRALGSGFVIDKAGHVVTNYHVIQNAKSIEVSFSNNESLKAELVGTDPSTDLAVLEVHTHSRALTPLPLGDSDSVRVGDSVVAIGNPFGLDRSITAGIVSALQRPIQPPNGFTIDHVIQTDAALNHGNSGGPLLNAEGEVVGVNAQIQTDSSASQGNVGVGFAIPVNTLRNVAGQLIKTGRVEHAFLGIGGHAVEPQLASLFNLGVSRGILVEDVEAGSGAAQAGLRGGTTQVTVAGETYRAGGDVIVQADGIPTDTIERLRDIVASKRPGDSVKLEISRGGERRTLTVKLGRQPTSPPGR
jgi:S1-C subfamily serine protease